MFDDEPSLTVYSKDTCLKPTAGRTAPHVCFILTVSNMCHHVPVFFHVLKVGLLHLCSGHVVPVKVRGHGDVLGRRERGNCGFQSSCHPVAPPCCNAPLCFWISSCEARLCVNSSTELCNSGWNRLRLFFQISWFLCAEVSSWCDAEMIILMH